MNETMNDMDEEDLRRPTPRVRLKFMKSPIIGSTDALDSVIEPQLPGVDKWHQSATLGAGGFATYRGEAKGLPIFRKVCSVARVCPYFYDPDVPSQFEDASLLELFTDLFFAANYTVFTQTQQVTDSTTLASYIGYFASVSPVLRLLCCCCILTHCTELFGSPGSLSRFTMFALLRTAFSVSLPSWLWY